MDPKLEKQVKKWMEKPPCPKEDSFPEWLLFCKCISCRKERKRIGLELAEDEPMFKSLSREHKERIRIALKKSWARRLGG